MASPASCKNCGFILPAYSNDGLCPACMLRSVLEPLPAGEAVPPSRLALPRDFGAYELIEEIGRGGIGVVYRARQRTLDRTVALKLLLGGVYSSEATLRRFQIEAAAAAALRHPGIVAIHDYGEFEGQPYYTMELMEGRNLAQVSDGRPVGPDRAATFLQAIARAVQYAHGRGILHRDLKPSNVLIDHDDRARVADFGMAKRLDGEHGVTLTGQLAGSPNYAAPEQAAGREADMGVATDVYALGAILYHLLTGRPPFLAATLEETLRLLHTVEPVAPRELNPGVPPDLDTICLKCLAKEPARRYASAGDLADDLDRFLSHRPIRARPPSFPYRLHKYARRNRTVVIAAGAVLGSLVIGLGVALAGFRRAVAQQRATQAARAQAEELVGVIMRDAQPALEPYGRLPVMGKIAEASLHYFEQLPPELQNPSTEAAQATALDSLAWVRQRARDFEGSRGAKLRAIALWEKVLAARPDDPDAATALFLGELRRLNWFGGNDPVEKEKVLGGIVARFRAWRARFPENLRLKFGLANALAYWSYHAGGLGRAGALAGAQEAHALLRELLVESPGDMDVQMTYMVSFMAQIQANERAGNAAANIRVVEEAVAFADESLKKDPGNLVLLQAAAQASAMRGGREGALASRRHLETLTLLDPTNRRWRYEYARSFGKDAEFYRRDGRYAEARRVYAQIETLMLALGDQRPVRSEEWIGPRGEVLNAAEGQAEGAALMGDRAGAQAWLATAAARCGVICSDLGAANPQADWFTAFLWQTRVRVADALRDWPELERAARAAIAAIDAMPEVSTWHDAQDIRAAAVRALGQARLRQGDAHAAVPLLQEAQAVLKDGDETLAEALTASDDVAQARQLLEATLTVREADLAHEPGVWEPKRNLARTAQLLARVLDPGNAGEVARRRSLLDRAASLLDGPEAEARLTPADRELKAQIAALRAG